MASPLCVSLSQEALPHRLRLYGFSPVCNLMSGSLNHHNGYIYMASPLCVSLSQEALPHWLHLYGFSMADYMADTNEGEALRRGPTFKPGGVWRPLPLCSTAYGVGGEREGGGSEDIGL